MTTEVDTNINNANHSAVTSGGGGSTTYPAVPIPVREPVPVVPVVNENVVAAEASLLSRKRSRLLFNNSSLNNDKSNDHVNNSYGIAHGTAHANRIIIPTVDPIIHKRAIARRVRLFYPVLPTTAADSTGGITSTDGTCTTATTTNSSSLTGRLLKELKEDALQNIQQGYSQTHNNRNTNHSQSQIVIHRETDFNNFTTTSASSSSENNSKSHGVLALPGQTILPTTAVSTAAATAAINKTTRSNANIHTANNSHDGILTKQSSSSHRITSLTVPTPKWHPQWELSTVISSHLGWVRSIAFDPTNDLFATGSSDRTIKIFNFPKACVGANDALQLTLTGHISPIRGLAFSNKYPYLFSAGEDKMIKCWDLETNQVVRHYHGHLSGIFDLQIHPTLDLIVTGGRDAVARVWDIRTKHQVFCLTGHDNTIGSILTKSTDPQIVTGSYDSTIKLWDLTSGGKCRTTLTHHKKSVRALTQPSYENTFLSGASDTIKKWEGNYGKFITNFNGHDSIINTLSLNDDGVLVSGGDNGTIHFWDYYTGYNFQQIQSKVQPGSLDAENGIYTSKFDLTGTRLITGEADKTIKIWKQDENCSEITHPVDMNGWRKKYIKEAKQRK